MKNQQRLALLIGAALALAIADIHAIEITGTVRSVSGEKVTVATTGDNVPNAGDKAEIFFKIEGVEGDVSVASGSVLKVEGDSVQLRIENATGEVAKDQLVRIKSDNPQKRTAAAPPPPNVEDSNPTAAPKFAPQAEDSSRTASASPPLAVPSSTAPPRHGKLVFEDKFDDSKDRRLMEGNKNVNGERQMTVNPGTNRVWFYNNLSSDFYSECSVRLAGSAPSCAVGFSLRTLQKVKPSNTYDLVWLVPGAVGFASTRNGQTGSTQSQALPEGIYTEPTRSTVVGLESIGIYVRVFLDGTCVANFVTNGLSEGRDFGLAVNSTGQTACTAYFDDLKIYSASAAAQTSGEKKPKPRKR